jgi:hypothetical protein
MRGVDYAATRVALSSGANAVPGDGAVEPGWVRAEAHTVDKLGAFWNKVYSFEAREKKF